MRKTRGFSLVAALMLAEASAHAQVNTEPLRQQVAQNGVGARVRASATTYAGNTRGVIFSSSALLGGRSARNVAYLVLTGDYTRLNGALSVARWFAHLRHNYELHSWLWWEEFAQIESDRFRRVALRELAGTGPRFGLVQAEAFEVFYGASYMYERTRLDTEDRSRRGEGSAHRFSNYLALTLRAQERITLSSISYVQPRFDEPSDVSVLSVAGADFAVTTLLHTRIDATFRYDSVAPSDVKRSDFELKSSLELVF
jgi:uncharacterized protein DUF481